MTNLKQCGKYLQLSVSNYFKGKHMNEIICPNCKKAFKVDEAGFADILKQVRDHQFEEELQNRLNIAEKEKQSAVKLAEANIKNSLQEELAKKDNELIKLNAQNELALSEILNFKQTYRTQILVNNI